MSRVLCWFSCGAASAVAAKIATARYGERCEILYCDTLAYEHPDNRRFLADCSGWLCRPITKLASNKYADIYDVFNQTGWLVGPGGARCTTELKKRVRMSYQRADDVHIFGFTKEERKRADRFKYEYPDVDAVFPLVEDGITKMDCHALLNAAGIATPEMYRLGYKNNNCIGCVKGGKGYWNKIRVDFPDAFSRMAAQERKMGVAINSDERRIGGKRVRVNVFLDELDPTAGRYETEPSTECGVLCQSGSISDILS